MATPDAPTGGSRRRNSVRRIPHHRPQTGGCAVTELFRTLGKAHMLNILYIFTTEPGPHRFVDIQHRLSLSPNTLAERLKDLVNAGLLTRTVYNEIPPRVDYEATPKAHELSPVFDTLNRWATRNDLKPQIPAIQVTA
ncbi:MAG TPA: helix-turn-helix domain-containing protein [Thermoplasmata archaeon]|nr:helix-turn-helix domain-containing protein [Thermoplasmata archaeon]